MECSGAESPCGFPFLHNMTNMDTELGMIDLWVCAQCLSGLQAFHENMKKNQIHSVEVFLQMTSYDRHFGDT